MNSALVVSHTEKSIAYFTAMLNAASCNHITTLQSCGEARRLMLEREFDLVIINAPLRDESGENLSRHIASKGISQVILVVQNKFYDAVSAVTEDAGVLVVARPVNQTLFWSALQLARSAGKRQMRMRTEDSRIRQRIDDIRMIDRAKCILMAHMDMSEQEAHRYIEKQAMDKRQARRIVAEGILKRYESE